MKARLGPTKRQQAGMNAVFGDFSRFPYADLLGPFLPGGLVLGDLPLPLSVAGDI
jgi:hypothetical protein